MKITAAIGARVGWALLTLAVLSVLIFLAMNYRTPEEIARAAIGRSATAEQLSAYAQAQGLTDPLLVRYGRWAGGLLSGDLGVSPVTNRSVAEIVLPELGRTLTLAAVGSVLGIAAAVWLGGFMARRVGTRKDLGVLMGTVALAATPEFVLGLALLLVFGVWLGVLPIESGSAFSFGNLGQQALAYVLPAVTVALAIVPSLYRFVRSSVRQGLQAQHSEAAELRGLSRRTVYWDFVVRNSAAPIINAAALNIVFAVSGLVAVETVMSFPGIGQQLVTAIGQGDAITVQAIAVILSAVILTVFLLSDALTLALNPRLRVKR